MRYTHYINSFLLRYFPLLIVVFSVFSYNRPTYFSALKSLIIPTLGVIMLGMGMTLRFEDFKRVLKQPADLGIGISVQYITMPFAGYMLARSFGLDPVLSAGVVLLGSCPGGTASNVITYLARGDVALSVTLTAVSTLLCPFFIPVLMYIFANQWINVPVSDLFISSVQIVLAPVLAGLLIRGILDDKLDKILELLPAISSFAIIFIVAVIVALNGESIKSVGSLVFIVVLIHNSFGLITGYTIAKFFGRNEAKARAISFEIGMQNSGLAVALAGAYFGALAALPGAVFSVWHNISGSALASYWQKRTRNK